MCTYASASEEEDYSGGVGTNRIALWDPGHGTGLVDAAHGPLAVLRADGVSEAVRKAGPIRHDTDAEG
ncbi:MAG: hypothetical protein WCK58_03825 [Chloroflexota bacterium]